MEEQVVAIYAGINGYLDEVPVEDVPRFQDELRERLRTDGAVYEAIKSTGDLSDETTEKLNAELDRFKEAFQPTQSAGAV
jgi:F-type H+-transporting ATPase subunit alpha